MIRAALLTIGLVLEPAAQQMPLLKYTVDLNASGQRTLTSLAVDSSGNAHVAGSVISGGRTQAFVAEVDRNAGSIAWSFMFGSGTFVTGIAIDAAGSTYVIGTLAVGTATGSDVPLVNPVRESGHGFLAKINASGNKLLFSTRLGDLVPSGLAVDDNGGAYVGGFVTSESEATPGALRLGAGGRAGSLAAVARLDTNRGSLAYLAVFGGTQPFCRIPGTCTGRRDDFGRKSDIVSAVALGPGGVYVAGRTTSIDFPLTPGAPQQVCGCDRNAGDAFIAKLSPDGSKLLYSTYLGGPSSSGELAFGEWVTGLAVNGKGEAHITGITESDRFPVSPTTAMPLASGVNRLGFAVKLNAAGTAFEYSRYVASGLGRPSSPVLDGNGNVYLSASLLKPAPVSPGAFPGGNGYLAILGPDGSDVFSTGLPSGGGGVIAMGSREFAYVLSSGNQLSRWDFTTPTPAQVLGVANSAGGFAETSVAPGEIVSIYGTGLGPDPGVSFHLDSNRRAPTSLAGARVFFGNLQAPVLYVSQDQINAIVPYGVAPLSQVFMRVEINGALTPERRLRIVSAAPGLYRNRDFHVAALNEDGTVNTADNPAKAGSVVTVFGTGQGLANVPQVDGAVAGEPNAIPLLPIRIGSPGNEWPILYAGSAPGLLNGVLQVNFRLPAESVSPLSEITSFQLQIGDANPLNGGYIYTRPK